MLIFTPADWSGNQQPCLTALREKIIQGNWILQGISVYLFLSNKT